MGEGCQELVDPKEEKLEEVIHRYRSQKGALIPILQQAQDIYGYLPEHVLRHISQQMKIPIAKIYGVVTFYAQFRLTPIGRNVLSICLGTACHVRGGAKVLDTIEKELKVKDGETTEDGRFTLEIVNCIGACGLAPVISVNGEVHGRLTPEQIPGILAKYE
ncbi:NADH-quinone oxidoreductase subunit NuoE [Desulfitobacterium sp. AusDCA]|uniref:NADH-quinone oxidoreductase subunit NuoE n=1 Tax=Desulfitobacterium sp. AusDCA TaxID=3240383 RepID=UPI003DA6E03B